MACTAESFDRLVYSAVTSNDSITHALLRDASRRRSRNIWVFVRWAGMRLSNWKASHAFEKTRAEYDDARRAINTAQEEVRLAEERKNTLLNEQSIRKRKENELLAELNSKQAALRELWKEGELCEKRRDAVWNSIKDGREEIVNLRRELKSLSSKIDHVSNGIIKSPTRFLLDVEDQKASIKSLQKQCDTERQRICDNEEAIRVVEQISKALDELSRKVDQLRDWQKLVISSEEQAKTHERTYELYSSRLQDLKSRMEELSSVVKKLQENGCSGRNELSQLKKELVRLRNEKIREEETVRTACLELHRLFNDLLEKTNTKLQYHRAEEKFNMESRLFSDVLHSISSALDDTEDAASDEVI
uniref:Myosin_tail_1 domain-containing protein n=1 Tax=Angiostrongylus cantonensis TaxID=6313 RepID=A0A0K0DQN3_ANGCA